jgi:hypothetical protein
MGQFKPMVKMMTTEPTVELKLKKGGAVAMKKGGSAKKEGKKMADGGTMGALAGTPALVGRPAVNAPVRAPMRPGLSARRKAMAAPMRPTRPMMKEGGETKAEHAKEMKTAEDLKKHKAMPASKAHKGLKTGGVVKGQGGYKTGGVVMGQGGYKKGGKVKMAGGGKCYADGGIITEKEGSKDAGVYKNTKMVTTKPDHSPAKTGEVKLGNGGGYKKGGAAKKYAKGGSVNDSGKAVEMPQGQKKPSTPVSINQLSGTFKKGGQVKSMTPAEKRLTENFDAENAPAMKAAKSKDVEIYSKYGKMKMRSGGKC